MKASLRVCALSLLVAQATGTSALAGDATFSHDGSRVYVTATDNDLPALRELDLNAQTARTIRLPQLGKGGAITGLTRSSGDTLYLTTLNGVWSFTPHWNSLSKATDAPKNVRFLGVAYNPATRQTFLTADNGLFLLKNGRELEPVIVRRHNAVACPFFTGDGELFFAVRGDLWHGRIKTEESPGGGLSLEAYRYAPLAALETANTTPGETGVQDLVVTGESVYVRVGRMGGSGYGWLLQLPRPQPAEDADSIGSIEPATALPGYVKALQAVKILGENNLSSNLCVSPDAARVYYSNRPGEGADEDWFIADGATQRLNLRLLAAVESAGVREEAVAEGPAPTMTPRTEKAKPTPRSAATPARRKQPRQRGEKIYEGRPVESEQRPWPFRWP